LYDPKDELDPDAVYAQIVQPGIVKLPQDFKVEILGQYGKLTVAMPDPALLSAAKLVRGDPRDIEDVAWWVKERALDLDGSEPRLVPCQTRLSVKPPAKIFS
jgi:hypothetical protein